GSDRFTGGAGNDTVDYSKRSTPINVDDLRDIVSGDEHDSVVDVVETLIGTAGDDRVHLSSPPENDRGILVELFGGPGNDQLVLTPFIGNVSIHGGDGNDVMSDNAFDDLANEANFFGDAGDDVTQASSYPCIRIIHGGTGIDTADYTRSVGGTNLSLNNIADDFTPPRIGDGGTLFGNIFDDVENLVGTGNGQNNLTGSDGDNVLTTYGAAPSSILGLGGNDVITGTGPRSDIVGGTSVDTVDGGAGIDAVENDPRDSIVNTESIFALPAGTAQPRAITRARPPAASSRLVGKKLIVYGSTGDDVIRITQTSQGMAVSINADTKVYPTASVKTISLNAQAGNDRVYMFKKNGTGRVTRQTALYGGDGNDTLQVGDAATMLSGNLSGGHALFGGSGNDLLVGGNGRDYLDGGDQNSAAASSVDTDDGRDTLVGALGNDIVDLKARNAATTIRFNDSKSGNAAEDVIDGIENVFGGRGADDIIGDVGSNMINSGIGNDTIHGGSGLDRIYPSDGVDLVFVNDDTSYDFVSLNDRDADRCFFSEGIDVVGRDNLDELNPP
ncbi:MAG: hypothetical protein H7Z14_11190, partial [Anaerolineae bacterium]|nr:hypothetical protein [Phycisphaerae bacterium]